MDGRSGEGHVSEWKLWHKAIVLLIIAVLLWIVFQGMVRPWHPQWYVPQ